MDPWDPALVLPQRETFHVGSMKNGWGVFTDPGTTTLVLTAPNGQMSYPANDGFVQALQAGVYTLQAVCGSVTDTATITVQAASSYRYGIGMLNLNATERARVTSAGATATHVSFNWDTIEPNPPSGGVHSYNWSGPDAQIQAAQGSGLAMFAYSGSTPAWANPNGGSVAFGPPDAAHLNDFRAFFTALSQRYCGQVRYYEFWNEPNGGGWNAGLPTYVYWLREWYSAMKAGCTETVLSIGGLDCNITSGNSCRDFVDGIYNNGGGDSFDAVSLHPYGSQTAALNWTSVNAVSSVLSARGHWYKLLWLDEWGFDWNNNEPLRASLVDAALQQMVARSDVFEARYLMLTDIGDGKYWGLTESDPALTPRQSWYAFCNVTHGGSYNVPATNWKAEYFANTTLTGFPYLVRDDGFGALNHSWGSGGPNACGVGADNFSARYTRDVSFAAGTWRFTAVADDAVWVYVDGVLVTSGTTPGTYSGVRTLTAGTHSVVVTHVENSGTANVQVSWAAETVPAAPTNVTATAINGTTIRVAWTDNSSNESGFLVRNGATSAGVGANVTSYDWPGLAPGTYMCFFVNSFNSAGYSANSTQACATTPTPPAAPTGPTATALDGANIRVGWTDASSNEQGFEVSNGVSSVFVGANTTQLNWGGLAPNTYMCFRIRAYNAAGASAWTTPDACTSTLNVPPTAPTNPVATALDGANIRVSWSDLATNEQGFEVSNGSSSVYVGANTTQVNWGGLSPGAYMCFHIRSYNAGGSSAWTAYACATTLTPPAVPTGVTATAINGTTIRVTWADTSSNETGFTVGNGVTSANVGANATIYDWVGLSPGTYMCFFVKSFNSVGSSAWSAQSCATTPTIPAAPGSPSATAVDSANIRVGWADLSANEQGFEVSNGSNSVYVGANTTQLNWGGLAPNTSMCFHIRAYNPAGSSAWTAYACATTLNIPPAAPANPSAVALDGANIRVGWSDRSSNEQGFEVSNGSSSVYVGANTTQVNWGGLAPGTYMCFHIRAYNGAGSSAWTSYACTTTLSPPAAPTGQSAFALDGNRIQVGWFDNSGNENGFEVSNGVTSYYVGANTTAFTWSGLAPGTYMCFHIRAYNPVGSSAWTPYACTTTPTIPAAPTGIYAQPWSTSSFRISWYDNSSNETGFQITNGVTTYNLAANTTSFIWGGLASHVYMCFAVRSFNGVGYSAWTPWSCGYTY